MNRYTALIKYSHNWTWTSIEDVRRIRTETREAYNRVQECRLLLDLHRWYEWFKVGLRSNSGSDFEQKQTSLKAAGKRRQLELQKLTEEGVPVIFTAVGTQVSASSTFGLIPVAGSRLRQNRAGGSVQSLCGTW